MKTIYLLLSTLIALPFAAHAQPILTTVSPSGDCQLLERKATSLTLKAFGVQANNNLARSRCNLSETVKSKAKTQFRLRPTNVQVTVGASPVDILVSTSVGTIPGQGFRRSLTKGVINLTGQLPPTEWSACGKSEVLGYNFNLVAKKIGSAQVAPMSFIIESRSCK